MVEGCPGWQGTAPGSGVVPLVVEDCSGWMEEWRRALDVGGVSLVVEDFPVGGGLPQMVHDCPEWWRTIPGGGGLPGVVEHCPGDGGLPQVIDDCPSWWRTVSNGRDMPRWRRRALS